MMRTKLKKRLLWAAGVGALLAVVVLGWWVWTVQVFYGYCGAAAHAGAAYGLYFNAHEEWPADLPTALNYAREHAKRDGLLFKALQDPRAMAYLNDIEVRPGLKEELGAKIEDWSCSGAAFESALEKSKDVMPISKKSPGLPVLWQRRWITREFYSEICEAASEHELRHFNDHKKP